MTDSPDKPDYRSTVFLPTTSLPMKAGLPEQEPRWLAKWDAADLYGQLRSHRRGREKFILHDGPPYANGDMHIGHALNHILKDMVVRTQTLLGKDAPYVPGWDCHGLPIEWKVEEQYRKKKLNKDEVPVKEFRAECRAYAQNWVNIQRDQLKRLGINADWDHPYLTMDFAAEATIVAELMKFAESGQLYRGAKPVMWSPVEKTALAEAEIEYEDIVSTQIDVAFEIINSPIKELIGAYAVIWTTTPWTIPVNQAIAYGPEVEYSSVKILTPGCRAPGELLVATSLLDSFMARIGCDWHVVMWQGKGSDLAGTFTRHPMANRPSPLEGEGGEARSGEPGEGLAASTSAHTPTPALPLEGGGSLGFFDRLRPFLPGDFVTTDSGTGLVHMAPDHGEDDFDLCKAHGIEPVFAVNAEGKYRDDWAWLGGQGSVINPKFNAPDGPICADLRASGGLIAASADYKHSYPHSWRSKAKVIYRCTPQWFVPMDKTIAPPPRPSPARGEGADFPSPLEGEGGARALAWEGEGKTLRQTALNAITDTRWVPAKGENRIRAMVEGRPDWVLSRQRAWGVPITLFVHRKTGQYLCDAAVNARIVDAIKREGVDAWEAARAQEHLGDAYDAADYERVTDILDVWFDSGCTHAFVLDSGRWPDLQWPADLYLEGSDQHRGWFQSSLLQSCATRGRAPYKAVLTHGFTMDARGMKMSKSLGNTIDPLKVMQTNGADIIRLWALSVDFTEDHRIGDEILKGVADQYRKLRNTFRYLLGALDGFSDAEKISVDSMPELERYMQHLLANMDAKLRTAVNDFDFNSYVRLLNDFANNDLSAFFFDIRKDCLYCDAPSSEKRRAYRTVLDIIFHALIRYAAPVIVFTAEEVWQTRFPDTPSVHLLEWPTLPIVITPAKAGVQLSDNAVSLNMDSGLRRNDELADKWNNIRKLRRLVTEQIEPMRRAKEIGSSLEVQADVIVSGGNEFEIAAQSNLDWSELFITSGACVTIGDIDTGLAVQQMKIARTTDPKCERCWRHVPDVGTHAAHPALCLRCTEVVAA